jgi:hypothetical protein
MTRLKRHRAPRRSMSTKCQFRKWASGGAQVQCAPVSRGEFPDAHAQLLKAAAGAPNWRMGKVRPGVVAVLEPAAEKS